MHDLQKYLSSFEKNAHFQGVILVEKRNKIIFSSAFGNANKNQKNSISTIFQIGSLTKQFTAAAILKLGLDLKESILFYLPEKYHSSSWKEITVAHLLGHTSGIPNYTDDRNYFKKRMTVEKIIEKAKKQSLHFQPGSDFEYSNTGYLLLGLIIEAQSQVSYGAYLKEHFFQPLGMKRTGVYEGEEIPGRAKGYCFDKHGLALVEDHSEAIESTFSDGAIYSTVEDFNRWCHFLMTLDSTIMASGSKGYKYGLEFGKAWGRGVVCHSGSVAGYNADFCIFLGEKVHIIVFGNNLHFNAAYLTAKISKFLFVSEELSDVVPYPDDFYFSGRYRSRSNGNSVEFYQKKGKVLLDGAVPSECLLLSNNRLFNPFFGTEFEMDRNGNIKVYNAYNEEIDDLF